MLKLHYLLGSAFVAVAGLAMARVGLRPAPRMTTMPAHTAPPVRHTPAPPTGNTGAQWFQQIKPFCNSVEVETASARRPAPAGTEGSGYAAACFALAGKIDAARERLRSVPAGERYRAAGIVFEIAHPVADAGDDRSAGPIMALVVEFWPNHYMALYHAGASEAALGSTAAAREHLARFLELYHENDGWRSNAIATLKRLGSAAPADAKAEAEEK
jgi:hypothetical protein